MFHKFAFVFIVLTAISPAFAQRPLRFVGKLADGTYLEGTTLANWHQPDAAPNLDGRPLLDANNPLLWLRDRQLTPGPTAEAYVEMFSGDRLPGVPVGFRDEGTVSLDQSPAHWIVRPSIQLRPPRQVNEPLVRVVARYVRRVVWQRRASSRYRPATLFFRDGRSATFRSARLGEDHAFVLLPDGTRRDAYDEIAELHMPVADFWETYLDELAVLCPDAPVRLLQIETPDGAVATTSLERFAVHAWGGPERCENWAHGIQPAWSLDVLWVPAAGVWVRRMFAPHEVPLSRVLATEPEPAASQLPALWPPQVNRNVQGGALRSADREYGWGFGVQAFSQLQFPISPLTTGLRAQLGLDQMVGDGGCVQARVAVLEPAERALYESPIVVGSRSVQPLGPIALPVDPPAKRELVLKVDPVVDRRPAGADPFDIRDSLDWLEPVLELNRDQLRLESRRRIAPQIPAWSGWQAVYGEDFTWPGILREFPDQAGSFVRGARSTKEALALVRPLRLEPGVDWCLLAVSQDRAQQRKPTLQVRLDGETIFTGDIPFADKSRLDVEPQVIDLRPYHGTQPREVAAEIRQVPGEETTPVYWRGIATFDRLPMIRTLFDDDGAFVPDGAGAATPAPAASLVADDKYSLQKAIKLPAGARYRLDLRGQAAVRERPGWGQFRFLRFAFRKSGAGRACLELEHREAANRPARYDAGVGEPSYGAAKRVRDQALPGEWVEFTRDLFADFGPLDIDGVSLSAPDGDYVLFDQIYLAKTIDDFRHLPKRLPPELTNADAKKTAEKAALERALPACVSVAFGDGRVGTGMLISPDGDVLTAGHLAIGPIRTARIHLADGRSLEGQTRGVCRDLDLGIVRISTPGPYPWAEIENFTQLAADDWYFAVARKGKIEPGAAPITAAANVRRVVGSNVWTDFDPADWSAGGVLLNRYGRLVAVHTHRSRFGGAIHSLLASARPTIDRMRNGEFWGRWSAETTPASGLTLRTTGQGCQATAVAPGSSAAGQGLQPADLITRVDGRPVLMSDDVWQAQAEKDPGATVDLEYRRGTQTSTARIYLAPRLP